MAVTAEELNIILQVRDAQFQKQLKRNEQIINRFSTRGQRQFDNFGRSYSTMGKSVGQQRMALQNASFQLQDIITQVSMGTPVVRALSIQLPQLLGGFGAMGAAIGVAVGALGFLPSLLGDTSNEVEGLDKAMEELEKSTKGATDQLQMLELGLASIAQLRAQQQINQLLVERQKIEQELESMGNRAARNARGRIAVINEEVALLEETITKNQEALDALKQKEKQIENNKKITEASKEATEELANASRSIDFSTAIEGAKQLAAELGVSLHQAMQILQLVGAARQSLNDAANPVLDPRDPRYDEAAHRRESFKELQNSGALGRGLPTASTTSSSRSSSGGGGGSAAEDVLADLIQEVALNEKLLGVSEAREQVMRRLGADAVNYSETEIAGVIARIEAYENEVAALEDIQAQQQSIADTIENSMTDAFTSIVDGTKSAEDAFKDMARSVIAELYRILVVQNLVGSFNAQTGQGSGLAGALGSIFFRGAASGRSVQAGSPYMVGEHGREPFVPAQNGRILSVAQAKSAIGGGGGGDNVNQTIVVNAGVAQTVRTEIKSLMPQILQAAGTFVSDKSRRSPTYRSAF